MSTVLKVVKSSVRKFQMKRLICNHCQGFHVIYDSRLKKEYDEMSTEQRLVHEKRVKEIENREGHDCECGEGILFIENEPFNEFLNGYSLVRCTCGNKVECTSFTNTCECGKDYGFNGAELADRSQWGYETGESWDECY